MSKRIFEKMNDQNIEVVKSGQAIRIVMVKEGVPLEDLLSQRKFLSQLYDIEQENEHMIIFKKREITIN